MEPEPDIGAQDAAGASQGVNLRPFTAAAVDTTTLINPVDQAPLWVRLSPAMR